MIKIIINADDFGIRKETTELICQAIQKKQISSTTILANGPSKELAKVCANECPFASYGIHLNLTSYESITKSSILTRYGVTNDIGVFTGNVKRINKYPAELLDAIKSELRAQMEAVLGMGITLSHSDSHHHIHTKSVLKECVADVLDEYGVKRVRKAQELEGFIRVKHPITWYTIKQTNSFYSSRFITTDLFYGIVPFFERVRNGSDRFKDIETIELMCHLGGTHQKEKQIVEDEMLKRYINYNLISYNDI